MCRSGGGGGAPERARQKEDSGLSIVGEKEKKAKKASALRLLHCFFSLYSGESGPCAQGYGLRYSALQEAEAPLPEETEEDGFSVPSSLPSSLLISLPSLSHRFVCLQAAGQSVAASRPWHRLGPFKGERSASAAIFAYARTPYIL